MKLTKKKFTGKVLYFQQTILDPLTLFCRCSKSMLIAEVKSRTQKSRPRPSTQKKSKAKDTGTSFLQRAISKKQKKSLQKKFLLELELRSRSVYVQAYVDDLAVLVTSADMVWIRDMAQKAINIPANWASEQELQFSSKKTENCTVHSQTESRFGFFVNEWFKT